MNDIEKKHLGILAENTSSIKTINDQLKKKTSVGSLNDLEDESSYRLDDALSGRGAQGGDAGHSRLPRRAYTGFQPAPLTSHAPCVTCLASADHLRGASSNPTLAVRSGER